MNSSNFLYRFLYSLTLIVLILGSAASIFSIQSCSKGITESHQMPQDSTAVDTLKKDTTATTIPPALEITIEPKYYTSMALSPDGSLLALGDALDRVIRIWDTKTGNLISTIPLAPIEYPSALHFSKDNTKILCADGMAISGFLSVLYGVTSQKKICSVMSLKSYIADDGNIIGDGFDTVYPFAARMRVYSPIDGSFLQNITPSGIIQSPSGLVQLQIFGLVNAGSAYLYSPDKMNTVSPQVTIWSTPSNAALQTIDLDGKAATGILSDDGTVFGVVKNDSTLSLYSVATGQKFSEIHPQIALNPVSDSGYSLSDQLPAIVLTKNLVGSLPLYKNASEIRLFNNADGKLKGIYKSTAKYLGMTYDYSAIAISRDESLLIGWTGTTRNKIHIWHLK